MSAADQNELLNSWKEIATYLNRGVRTVQRWEIELGLPVRRPRGKSRSAVMAMRAELDAWIKACPVTHVATANGHVAPPALSTTAAVPRLNMLILQSRELQTKSQRLCTEVHTTVGALVSNLRKMSNEMSPRIFRVQS